MARPQGTCTIAAANRILSGLAIVAEITTASGNKEYQATLNNDKKLYWKSNTDLVAMVIDYAIENGISRKQNEVTT